MNIDAELDRPITQREMKMKPKWKIRLSSAGIAILLVGAWASHAVHAADLKPTAAAPLAPISITDIEHYDIPGTDMQMLMQYIVFAPGVSAPLHYHPGVGLNYIIEGTAETAFENDEPQTFRTGDHFQDKAVAAHTVFRNPDLGKPLKFLVFYTIRHGEQPTTFP